MLAQITDLTARAAARAMIQYKSLTKFMGDVGVLTDQVQELENAFWAFLTMLDIDSAVGVWIDRLGERVGETRDGDNDTVYRYAVKARVLANASQGTSEDILAVTAATLADFGLTMELVDWYPAAQALNIGDSYPAVLDARILRVVKMLARAKAVAVQMMLLWQPDADSSIFVCGDALGGVVTGLGFDDAAAPNDPSAGQFAGALNA